MKKLYKSDKYPRLVALLPFIFCLMIISLFLTVFVNDFFIIGVLLWFLYLAFAIQ
jgi:hypothetical protein